MADKLPISVIVPHVPWREVFFKERCLPSIEQNNPKEIIIIEGHDIGSNAARNKGARISSQPYILFCDDDVVLLDGALKKMMSAIDNSDGVGFAYSDSYEIWPDKKEVSVFVAGGFDPERLRVESYISIVSLMRKEVFPGFDESVRRMQDWDLWLTVVGRGVKGVYIAEPLYENYHFDPKCITMTENLCDALTKIKAKHHLGRIKYEV